MSRVLKSVMVVKMGGRVRDVGSLVVWNLLFDEGVSKPEMGERS